MNTDSNTGTLIVRIVGITKGQGADSQKLPVLMTGVLIRVVPGREVQDPVPSTALPGERRGHSGADGQIGFTDLPAGHYRIFAAGHDRPVELSPGCDLVQEIEPTIGFQLILPDQGSYLSLDTIIP